MISKAEQTRKAKKHNPKKLSVSELKAYKETIHEGSMGLCQLCQHGADDFHHPFFGSYGADKDDRYLIALCRRCHEICHEDKHGETNMRAKAIAEWNWSVHNDMLQ